jgi:hypothetical protein
MPEITVNQIFKIFARKSRFGFWNTDQPAILS